MKTEESLFDALLENDSRLVRYCRYFPFSPSKGRVTKECLSEQTHCPYYSDKTGGTCDKDLEKYKNRILSGLARTILRNIPFL